MYHSSALFMLLLALAATPLSASAPLPDLRCRVDSVHSVHYLLSSADAVVQVEALRQLPPASGDARQFFPLPADRVELRVVSVLKGSFSDSTLVVHGQLSEKDDFNNNPVPYAFVRPEGGRGSCFAGMYRSGAQYLLILKSIDGAYSPYWSPLAPTNEQIRGDEDPWIWWVRGYLDALEARPGACTASGL
jgi:hypothetical protein